MDEQELIQETKREYMREYMRDYRKRNKERVKENENRFWLKQARAQVECRSLEQCEKELELLKQWA